MTGGEEESAELSESVERGAVALSLIAVGFVTVASRAYIYSSVFRNGDVVLLSNDPYKTRQMVDEFLARSAGVFDIGAFASFPPSHAQEDPLMVATIGWVAELLGGDPHTAGIVLAWYPVLSALVTIGLVYLITRRVTGNHWIGVTAALMLAITPVHVYRTALGFGDHHAFDHPWLALTVLCLVWLADSDIELRSRRVWIVAAILGVAVAGQTLAWHGAPLLTVPIGMYAAIRILSDVRAGRSPLEANVPMIAGLGVGSILVWVVHSRLSWHLFPVALQPMILTVGVVVVVVLGEMTGRWRLPSLFIGIAEIIGLGGLLAITLAMPAVSQYVTSGLAYFSRTAESGVAETVSLIGGPAGVIAGPLSLFGLVLFVAVPYLVLGTWATYRENTPDWLVLVVYMWYFVVLALIQRRFAEHLALVSAIFAGVGLIDVAARLGVIHDRPLFDSTHDATRLQLDMGNAATGIYPLAIVIIVLITVSYVQIPIKMNQVSIDEETYETAKWIDDYAAEHEMEYPESYVFTRGGENRAYNYLVNREVDERKYWYARQRYTDFLGSTDAEQWYNQLQEKPTGFIVIRETTSDYPPRSLYSRLHAHYGSQTASGDGLGHYRLIYSSKSGHTSVFTLVPGAVILGRAPANETTVVSTHIEITGKTFTYKRHATPSSNGWYCVRVPYPGRYHIGENTTRVSDSDVRDGELVPVRDQAAVRNGSITTHCGAREPPTNS